MTKNYLALTGGFNGKETIIRFEAANDDQAFVMAAVENGSGLEELLLFINGNSGVTGREIITRDKGGYFDVEYFNPPTDVADFEDIYINEVTFLFNIDDNKVVYATINHFTLHL